MTQSLCLRWVGITIDTILATLLVCLNWKSSTSVACQHYMFDISASLLLSSCLGNPKKSRYISGKAKMHACQPITPVNTRQSQNNLMV
uniref:Uncharacterized protein n=1 Tax=Zea mays TaxID=4577 RepID=A0A804LGB2_MAIZE